jgi:hypothetical protein
MYFSSEKTLSDSVYQIFNQLNGYGVWICHALLFIIGATDICACFQLHRCIYNDSNANLYIVLVRFSSYFRVWQEGADCLIAVLGSSFYK